MAGQRTWRDLYTPGPRTADMIECVVAVLLAIAFAHLIGARAVYWATFTALVLMRGHVAQTVMRGVLRLVGTLAGAGLALLLVPRATGSVSLAMALAALVGAIGLYGMLAGRRAYAWLLFGLTFEMVMFDKLAHPHLDLIELARTRLLEVVAGTLACVAVSALSTVTLRRLWPGPPPPPEPARFLGWSPPAARHAVLAGTAIAVLPLIDHVWGLPALEQAVITIMAVLIVPVAELEAKGLRTVGWRLAMRALGCVVGVAYAALIVFLSQGAVVGLLLGTGLGVALGRHFENGATRLGYAGLQFTLVVLVALVPDSYVNLSLIPAVHRLVSIFVGMAVLVPILLVWHFAGYSRFLAPLVGTRQDAAGSAPARPTIDSE